MQKANIDIAVLLIFFNRPEKIEKVFESVKRARPARLYLYQDGARQGREDDIINVKKCRDIVLQIDWECEVYTKFQKKNYGCDPSEFIAQKWMFETEEMGIVLEDDDVPSQSFYPFCKELLIKYKDDERINMICGMNNTGVSNHIDSSYLFTKKGCIWGWASWKRVLDTWDGKYTWLNDCKKLELIKSQMSDSEYKKFISTATWHKGTGKEYYESINLAAIYINDSLNIVPKYNMISNIGVGGESTHNTDDIRLLPKKVRKLMHMKTYEIDFPLTHPQKMERDFKFEKEMTFTSGEQFCMRIESGFRTLIYKGPKIFLDKVIKKVKSF